MDSEKLDKVLNSISSVLIEKNKRYGNAALSPINVFYKGNAETSIYIRLDDKLSRIKNSKTLRKNDMFDLLGYCLLLSINNLVGPLYEECSFEEKVNILIKTIKMSIELDIVKGYSDVDAVTFNGFTKDDNRLSSTIKSLNYVCSRIQTTEDEPGVNYYTNKLICFIIQYFIDNDITDFNDLID